MRGFQAMQQGGKFLLGSRLVPPAERVCNPVADSWQVLAKLRFKTGRCIIVGQLSQQEPVLALEASCTYEGCEIVAPNRYSCTVLFPVRCPRS